MTTAKKTKPARKRSPRPHRPSESTWGPAVDRGPVLRVTLIGCGKRKAASPKPARELYTGALFRACLEHALATSEEVRIVSAKHGLVGLDDVIAPYDVAIGDLPAGMSRQVWAERVVRQLEEAFPGRALEVTLLMGGAYTDLLVPALHRARVAWERPLDGYPVGMRLWWLAREKEARATATAPVPHARPEPPVVASAPPTGASAQDRGQGGEAEPKSAAPVVIVGEGGQLELPHVGPLSRQLALFA